MREKKWDFYIDSYKRLHLGDPYEPFTGLVDYCLWTCLGFEADGFSPLGGQEFYKKAKLIADKARFEAKFSIGWDRREQFINDVLDDPAVVRIRTARYYFIVADHFTNKGEWTNAKSSMEKCLKFLFKCQPEMIDWRPSGHILSFIDRSKLAQCLRKLEDLESLDKLSRWDSEHSEQYQ